MDTHDHKQSGFTVFEAVLAVVIIGAVAGVGWLGYTRTLQSHAAEPDNGSSDVSPAHEGSNYKLATTITGSSIPPTDNNGAWCSDINYYDAANGKYYLADNNNKQVDVVDTKTDKLLAPIGTGEFTGIGGCDSFDFSHGGPTGILADAHGQLWVGNGDSTVHVYNADSGTPVATVDTGGTMRADEFAYDQTDNLILVTNPSEASKQFVTFIDAGTHKVVGRITFDSSVPGGAAPGDSLEQPAYNSRKHLFFMSVRTTDGNKGGEIAVINPESKKVDKVLSLTNCNPSGIALNANKEEAAVGCDVQLPAQIINLSSGRALAKIPQVTGVDEVWFNPGDSRYFFGSFGMPAIGVVDARNRHFVTTIPVSDHNEHAMAVSSVTNKVYFPVSGKGIEVYKAQ